MQVGSSLKQKPYFCWKAWKDRWLERLWLFFKQLRVNSARKRGDFWIEVRHQIYWKYPGWFTNYLVGSCGRGALFTSIWPMWKLRIFHLNWRWGEFSVKRFSPMWAMSGGVRTIRMDLCETDFQMFMFMSWIYPPAVFWGNTCHQSMRIFWPYSWWWRQRQQSNLFFLHCHQELVTIDQTNSDNLWILHMYDHIMAPILSIFHHLLLYPAMQTYEAILEKSGSTYLHLVT